MGLKMKVTDKYFYHKKKEKKQEEKICTRHIHSTVTYQVYNRKLSVDLLNINNNFICCFCIFYLFE